jgi:hypothetical protein
VTGQGGWIVGREERTDDHRPLEGANYRCRGGSADDLDDPPEHAISEVGVLEARAAAPYLCALMIVSS